MRLFAYSMCFLLLFTVNYNVSLAANIEEHHGQPMNPDFLFRNENGISVKLRYVIDHKHPIILMFTHYTCADQSTLLTRSCNSFLTGVTASLKKLIVKNNQWMPGVHYQLVTVSADPREAPEQAAKEKQIQIQELGKSQAADGWQFWVDTDYGESSVKLLAEQAGIPYPNYDEALIFLTPDGHVFRYLYGNEFLAQDLRLALLESGGGRIGSMTDKLLMFCYHYDPYTRQYRVYTMNFLRMGLAVVIATITILFYLTWRRKKY